MQAPRAAIVVAVFAVIAAAYPAPATVRAGYAVSAIGAVTTTAQVVARADPPIGVSNGRDVAVSWPTSTMSGGTPATRYTVVRHDGVGVPIATLVDCAVGGATSCVDHDVPPGTYRYNVQAGTGAWNGPASALGPAVAVSTQTFEITSATTITALPAVVQGVVRNFGVGETLTYRLDSATGTVLSGSPSMVADAAGQTVSINLPAGTSDTAHSLFVVGSSGSVASAAVNIVVPPTLQTLRMFDTDGNGKVDRVIASFDEPLAPYTAGVAPWQLTNVPSAGSLATAAASGSSVTLTLSEGPGASDTSVGGFTIALHANSAGVRDLNGNQASFSARAPSDSAPPAPISLVLLDANANGKVDRVTVRFSESLAAYGAGVVPWTLVSVPSGGTLSAVGVSGSDATLTVAEGAGAADTAVGAMTVALATNATGVRDSVGNLASFSSRAPADGAAPVPVTITDTNGTIDGRFQPGDTITITFSEALHAPAIPATTTLTVTDPPGNSNDTLTIDGISASKRTLGGNNYVTTQNSSAVFGASPVTLSNGNRSVTVTVGTTCTGSGCGGLGTQSTAATYSFVAAATVVDPAGNRSTQTRTVSIRMC